MVYLNDVCEVDFDPVAPDVWKPVSREVDVKLRGCAGGILLFTGIKISDKESAHQ